MVKILYLKNENEPLVTVEAGRRGRGGSDQAAAGGLGAGWGGVEK